MVKCFSNYMNKKLSFFEFYGYYEIIINTSKISIHYSYVMNTVHKVYRQIELSCMSKHNKGKEVFLRDMSMVIPMTMIFIGANLVKVALGSISCHKLNNCNMEFQLELVQKLLKVGFFGDLTSFVVTM